jgi:hypothetical protein
MVLMNAALSALCAILACLFVMALAVVGVHMIFGRFEWLVYAVLAFFGLMACMSRLNAT